MRRLFYKGITFKLIGALSCAILFIGFLIFAYNNYNSRKIATAHARENARVVAQSAIFRIQNSLTRIEAATVAIALYLEASDSNKPAIKKYLEHLVISQSEIFGATIALDPAMNRGEGFAPYFYKKGKQIHFSDLSEQNYNYIEKEWYVKTRATGVANWSKPYFDVGGGDVLMATYSVPIFHTADGQRGFIGVVTADISLDWLEKVVTPLAVFKNGYGFLLAEDGTYISHPLKNRIMHQTIFQVMSEEDGSVNFAQRMIDGEEGFVPHFSTYTNQPSYVFLCLLVATAGR